MGDGERPAPGGWLGPWLLVAFTAAGAFKASPLLAWFPVDLTAFLAVVVAGLAIHLLVCGVRPVWTPTVVMAVVVLMGAWKMPLADYGSQKVRFLLTLTFGVAFICSSVLLARPEWRRALVWATIAMGLFTVVVQVIGPGKSDAGRLLVDGANTTSTGRLVAAGIVGTVAMAATGQLRARFAAVFVLPMLWVALGTGSRGPLLGAAVACAVVLLVQFRVRPARVLVFAVLAVVALEWVWQRTPVFSRYRIELLFAADQGQSVGQRQTMWHETRILVAHQAFGVGWGNLAETLYPIDKYPHDLPLEVFGEAGWFGGALLLVLIAWAAVRAIRAGVRRRDPVALGLLGLLVFFFSTALVSGDINDQRPLFVLVVACFSLGRVSGRDPGGVDPSGARRPDRLVERGVEPHRASARR